MTFLLVALLDVCTRFHSFDTYIDIGDASAASTLSEAEIDKRVNSSSTWRILTL